MLQKQFWGFWALIGLFIVVISKRKYEENGTTSYEKKEQETYKLRCQNSGRGRRI
jgi:hypothetical protein